MRRIAKNWRPFAEVGKQGSVRTVRVQLTPVRLLTLGLLIYSIGVGVTRANPYQTSTPPKDPGLKEAFSEFDRRVSAYQKLRKSLESGLPALKPSPDAQTILAQGKELASKIADARAQAKQGDIFTEQISAEFRKLFRDAFRGQQGREAHRTIAQGEPLNLELRINQPYPSALPVTTVPPTLLKALPKLPANLQYKIVGRDFVLEDVRCVLVVDFIRDAVPVPAS